MEAPVMTIAKISLAFVAFGMLLTGYYMGCTWHQIGDPQPWDDFNVQVMFPVLRFFSLCRGLWWGERLFTVAV
jgi:hypothetical protein